MSFALFCVKSYLEPEHVWTVLGLSDIVYERLFQFCDRSRAGLRTHDVSCLLLVEVPGIYELVMLSCCRCHLICVVKGNHFISVYVDELCKGFDINK
jgi:hypothetical protein